MESLIKYQKLLLLLGVLMLAKFVWVPLWESKQTYWQQLSQGQHNLAKMQALITLSTPMAERSAEIAQVQSELEALIPQSDDLTSYKLTAQSELEALFKRHALPLSSTSLRDGIGEQDIHVLLLDLRFNGKLKSYLSLLQEFEQNKAFMNLTVISDQLIIRGQNADSLGLVDGTVSLQLAVKVLPSSGEVK